jgi:hypothetical protein
MAAAGRTRTLQLRRATTRAALLVALLTGTGGCARAMSVGSEAGPLYRITVENELAEAMIVSYNDGRGDAILGTVAARGQEHFAIGRPATTTIAVRARNTAGTRSLGPFSIELDASTARIVTLR